jgi:hypothetical protein
MFTSFLEVREATKVNYIAGLSSEFVDSICDILTQQHLDPDAFNSVKEQAAQTQG